MSKDEKRLRARLAGQGVEVLSLMDGKQFFGRVEFDTLRFADYQRGAITSHVRKIAHRFDVRAALPLQVSLRDGYLWVVDGRQRMAAMKEKGYSDHYAVILTGLSYEDEAKIFFDLNDVPRKMTGWTKFAAAVKAGSTEHREMLAVLRANNLSTPLDEEGMNANDTDVPDPGKILRAYDELDRENFGLFCQIIDRAWRIPATQKGSRGDVALVAKKTYQLSNGLIQYLKHNRKTYGLPGDYIIWELRRTSLDELASLARGKKPTARLSGSQWFQAIDEVMQRNRTLAA